MPMGCSRCIPRTGSSHAWCAASRPFHRRGRQGRKPDDVADRIYVLDAGAEVLVDGDPAAGVGNEACAVQPELLGGTLPAGRVHHGVGGDALPLSSTATALRGWRSTDATDSRNRKVTARS